VTERNIIIDTSSLEYLMANGFYNEHAVQKNILNRLCYRTQHANGSFTERYRPSPSAWRMSIDCDPKTHSPVRRNDLGM
jgi:hypothetical protein